MKKLISLSSKFEDAMTRMVSSLNNGRNDDVEQNKTSVRLASFLTAIPVLCVLNVATNPTAWVSSATFFYCIMSVAVVSIWLASMLMVNNKVFLAGTYVALSPVALALITGGTTNVVGIAVLILSILGLEAYKKPAARMQLAIGSILTVSLTSILLVQTPTFGLELKLLIGLVPACIAIAFYIKMQEISTVLSKSAAVASQDNLAEQFELACACGNEAGAAVLLIDRTASVRSSSASFFNVFELNNEDLIGPNFLNRINVGDKVMLLSQIDSAATGQPSDSFRVRMNCGVAKWRQVRCKLVKLQGQLLLFIYPQNEPSAQTAGPNMSLEARALTIVSHELRTPLNAIIGFSDLLGKGLAGELANTRQQEYIGLIQESGQHLLELVNSILDLSKLENGSYELDGREFLPTEAAEFAIAMLGSQAASKGIGLSYKPHCAMELFYGDKRVVQQIAINLLSNAVKFTPAGGQISFEMDISGDKLTVKVSDTGIGMSSDELANIGTPFYQANAGHNRNHEGAGIGLSLVRKLCKHHGGAMEIASEPGKGTSVRIVLAAVNQSNSVAMFRKASSADERVRPIQLEEVHSHGAQRKTA